MAAPTRRKPVRVLLVEDNPGDARLVKEALGEVRSADFQLTHVEHLHEGLRRLARHKFDVILLDLLLEDTPRLGALLEIYEQSSRVPVVVLTGLEDEAVGLWALKEGAHDYFIKGMVAPERLAHSLLEAVEQQRATHAARSGGRPRS